MKLKDFKAEANKYTELELQVLRANLDINKDGTFLVYIGDIQCITGIDTKILRGVISSLVKKDAIYVDQDSENLISVLDENYCIPE